MILINDNRERSAVWSPGSAIVFFSMLFQFVFLVYFFQPLPFGIEKGSTTKKNCEKNILFKGATGRWSVVTCYAPWAWWKYHKLQLKATWFEIEFSHSQVTSSAVLAKNCVGVAARKCGCLEAIPSHRSDGLYEAKPPPVQYKALLMWKRTEKEKHTSSNHVGW